LVVECSYQYTGQEFDEEVDLHNFRARFYDSDLMNFYSVDPLEEFASSYLYCGNDPIKLIDKDGKRVILTGAKPKKVADVISEDAISVIYTYNKTTESLEWNLKEGYSNVDPSDDYLVNLVDSKSQYIELYNLSGSDSEYLSQSGEVHEIILPAVDGATRIDEEITHARTVYNLKYLESFDDAGILNASRTLGHEMRELSVMANFVADHCKVGEFYFCFEYARILFHCKALDLQPEDKPLSKFKSTKFWDRENGTRWRTFMYQMENGDMVGARLFKRKKRSERRWDTILIKEEEKQQEEYERWKESGL